MGLKLADTVFAGFGVVGREPLSVVAWFLAYLAFLVVAIVLIVVAVGGQAMFNPNMANDPAAAMNVFRGMIGVFLIMVPLFLIAGAILNCAVFRTVLRPEEKGFARMRIGGDEMRVALVMFMTGLLFFVGYIVCAIVGFLLAMAAGAIGGILMVVLVLGYAAWFYTFFSFAGPQTFAKRKFLLFSGTDIVNRQFWPLLGCYLLVAIVVFLLYIAIYGVQYGILGAMTGSFNLQTQMQQGMGSGKFTAAAVVSTVLGAIMGAVILPVMVAPAAVAYRDIVGPDSSKQADVFA